MKIKLFLVDFRSEFKSFDCVRPHRSTKFLAFHLEKIIETAVYRLDVEMGELQLQAADIRRGFTNEICTVDVVPVGGRAELRTGHCETHFGEALFTFFNRWCSAVAGT